MELRFSGDYDAQSHLDLVYDFLDSANYHDFFKSKNYGIGLDTYFIVLISYSSDYIMSSMIKPRIRYSAKDKTLYADIIIPLEAIQKLEKEERNQKVLGVILEEVPIHILKYKKKLTNVNVDKFIQDFNELFGKLKQEVEF